MAGLLDFATDPQSAMMTQMALGLLSAGGPSSRPVSLGQAIGQAGQMGMQGYKDAQTNQVNQMKLDELKKRMAFMQNMPNMEDPNFINQALQSGALDLNTALPLMMKDKEKPELVELDDPANPGRTVKKWVTPGKSDGTNIGYAPMKAPEGMQYANGQLVGIPGYVDMKKQIAAAGRQAPNATPYFQFLPTADGYVAGNARTGQVAPVFIGGKTVMRATDSPLLQGQIAGAKAEGTQLGTGAGESAVKLKSLEKELPGLEKVVTDLSALGKKATYTVVGQAIDTARRQTGMDVGPGAVARKEYIAKVDNEVLPLLRSTFGAQFTQKEGESLKATLGDPNVSPEEKDAVLRSFIQSKRAQIEGMKGTTSPTKPAQTFDAKPPAHQFKGKSMTGPDGRRYRSDGMIWKEVK